MVRFIISSRILQYTSFWWWYRLINHEGFRFDDYHVWGEFWHSLNSGWHDMQYKYEFEKFWGKGTKPEKIILPKEDFDALVERLNQPPDPKVVERFKQIMSKPAPWDREE